jgi:soluble lytic murein transglycosylase
MSFDRYISFVRTNPSWPSVTTLRRRAEASLWDDRRDAATVRRFFGSNEPSLAKGHLALAKALLQSGDQAGAQRQVREAWISDDFSEALENTTLQTFGSLLTRADHRARMHARFYANDTADAMRAAHRLGGEDLAVAQARLAVLKNAPNAKALLDAVPADARRDPGYIFSRCQWLRRHDHVAEAARLMHTVPHNPALLINTDKWWQERRSLARELIDAGDARAAYTVVRDAALPTRHNYAVEREFMAGWIALRFLRDPSTALTHFSRMTRGIENPISLARAGYWQGRAADALGHTSEARAHYSMAARYSTAYYGQLARARLGEHIALRRPPTLSASQRATLNRLEVVRAIDMLYALNERGFVAIMAADLGDKAGDVSALSVIAEKAKAHGDARAMLLAGKLALARGLPMDVQAFPTAGLPRFRDIGPPIDIAIVYAIARQESGFNPNTVSRAKAMGYMQVTPEAGRYVAKKFGVSFDEKRLLSDPTYNMQMGAAELGDLLRDYHGSYILTFAGYNAGRGRVRTWIARYGDPRDPKVDPVDWVELIPFSETRNYVERVMENMQVYRALMGGTQRPLNEAELREGSSVN